MEDLGVFPSPQINYNGTLYPFHAETYAVTHLISSNCPYPDEAWKFMEFMTTMEAQQVITGSGMIPTNLDFSLSDEYKASEPLNAELAAFVDELYFFPAAVDPNIPQLGEMERIMIDPHRKHSSPVVMSMRYWTKPVLMSEPQLKQNN